MSEPCTLPPKGWRCKHNVANHDGPCPAIPVGFWHRLYWRLRLRTWDLGD